MKVIGLNDNGGYIAIVDHSELEKSAAKYYGNLPKLKVGDSFNIGAGYDFTSDIKGACEGMTTAVKRFEQAQATMTKFAVMVKNLPPLPTEPTEGGAS